MAATGVRVETEDPEEWNRSYHARWEKAIPSAGRAAVDDPGMERRVSRGRDSRKTRTRSRRMPSSHTAGPVLWSRAVRATPGTVMIMNTEEYPLLHMMLPEVS